MARRTSPRTKDARGLGYALGPWIAAARRKAFTRWITTSSAS
jgi:hypothetical protein